MNQSERDAAIKRAIELLEQIAEGFDRLGKDLQTDERQNKKPGPTHTKVVKGLQTK